MDLDISFLNNAEYNVDNAVGRVLKCLTELQTLRKENAMLKKDLTNAELNKQNLTYEVDKLKQTSKDLKGQINTAYSVINSFNKEQSERNSTFSHQTVKAEALKAENIFLTEQTSIFQENIAKLTIDKMELLAKCQQLEINLTIYDEKFANAWEFLQTLDKSIKKLEENQNSLKIIIDKSKIDLTRLNQTIKSNKSEQIQMKQENFKLTEKISELLMRIPLETQPGNSLIEECDKLTSALAQEKSKNTELSSSLAVSISNQNKIFKSFGQSCDKSVQTEL